MTTETTTIASQDNSPSLEEEAAALEAAKAAENTSTPPLAGEDTGEARERPEWLPEKFKTVEDMAKAYAELEKGKSAPDEETPEAPATEDAEKAAEAAGLDMSALQEEYAKDGELSEDSLKALEKQGITKDMVDMYVAGQQAQADAVMTELTGSVGGMEGYNALVEWAADALPDADIESFNAVLDGGDTNATKMAIENLKAKYVDANGSEPEVQLTGKPSNSNGSVYESTADLMKDMQNPEYASNPAFRQKVEAKLSRSNIM